MQYIKGVDPWHSLAKAGRKVADNKEQGESISLQDRALKIPPR